MTGCAGRRQGCWGTGAVPGARGPSRLSPTGTALTSERQAGLQGPLVCAELWGHGAPTSGRRAPSILGIDPPSPREGLSFGQRARRKCARKVTETTERVQGEYIRPNKAGAGLCVRWCDRVSARKPCALEGGREPHSCVEVARGVWREEGWAGAEEASQAPCGIGYCSLDRRRLWPLVGWLERGTPYRMGLLRALGSVMVPAVRLQRAYSPL